ncbi:hypothetical protein D9M68_922020 [compost metagenome]
MIACFHGRTFNDFSPALGKEKVFPVFFSALFGKIVFGVFYGPRDVFPEKQGRKDVFMVCRIICLPYSYRKPGVSVAFYR